LYGLDKPISSHNGKRCFQSIDKEHAEKGQVHASHGWEANNYKTKGRNFQAERNEASSVRSSDGTDDEAEHERYAGEISVMCEQTKLLPPTGISTNEYYDATIRRDCGSDRHPSAQTSRRSSDSGDRCYARLAKHTHTTSSQEGSRQTRKVRPRCPTMLQITVLSDVKIQIVHY